MRSPRARAVAVAVVALACLWGTAPAPAAPVIYHVTVNTSAISGTNGSVDFQFNPSGSPQALTATLSNFTAGPGTVFGAADGTTGNVTNNFPTSITLNNLPGPLNEAIGNLTYGSSFSYDVTFSPNYDDDPPNNTSFFMFLFDQPNGGGDTPFNP